MAATKVTTEDWIEELKSISVLELSERIKALEDEFGVSATAVAAAAPAASIPAAAASSTRAWGAFASLAPWCPIMGRMVAAIGAMPPYGRSCHEATTGARTVVAPPITEGMRKESALHSSRWAAPSPAAASVAARVPPLMRAPPFAAAVASNALTIPPPALAPPDAKGHYRKSG